MLSVQQRKFLAGIAFLAASALLYLLLSPYLSLEYLESQRSHFKQMYNLYPVLMPVLYVSITAILIGLPLPVTGIFALLSGALFGFLQGWVMISAAGTLGALFAFLWSRYLFRDWLQQRFQEQYSIVDKGIMNEGVYYLFSIRLIAVFPFFLVNILSGLTNIRLYSYLLVTFVGHTIVSTLWVYTGARIASLKYIDDILNLETIFILFVVGLLPLLTHRLVGSLRARCREHSTLS